MCRCHALASSVARSMNIADHTAARRGSPGEEVLQQTRHAAVMPSRRASSVTLRTLGGAALHGDTDGRRFGASRAFGAASEVILVPSRGGRTAAVSGLRRGTLPVRVDGQLRVAVVAECHGHDVAAVRNQSRESGTVTALAAARTPAAEFRRRSVFRPPGLRPSR